MKRPTITRSLRSFNQAYRPENVLVLNDTLQDRIEMEGTKIRFDTLTCLPERLTDLAS